MENILFVGHDNENRAPTAVRIFLQLMAKHLRVYNVQSAGVDPYSSVAVNKKLLQWADKIFVMEQHLLEYMPVDQEIIKKIVVLKIPRHYSKNQPELVELLKQQLATHTLKP